MSLSTSYSEEVTSKTWRCASRPNPPATFLRIPPSCRCASHVQVYLQNRRQSEYWRVWFLCLCAVLSGIHRRARGSFLPVVCPVQSGPVQPVQLQSAGTPAVRSGGHGWWVHTRSRSFQHWRWCFERIHKQNNFSEFLPNIKLMCFKAKRYRQDHAQVNFELFCFHNMSFFNWGERIIRNTFKCLFYCSLSICICTKMSILRDSLDSETCFWSAQYLMLLSGQTLKDLF